MSLKAGTIRYLPFFINQTDLLAGTAAELIAPENGYITGLSTTVQVAITTGGDIDVKTGDALGTTVAGLTQAIANSATKGTRQRTTATAGSSTRYVAKGARIGVVPSAAFDTGGAVSGLVEFESADTSPALPAA